MASRAGAFRKTAAILVALVALFGVACGNQEKRTEGEEGDYVYAGDAVYQVQLTRLLNPRIRADDVLARGQLKLPPDEQYLAVFLVIKNEGNKDYTPPRDMRVVDTEGNEYLPLDASQSNFGLVFAEPLPPDGVAPPPNSPATMGPDGAAMVLFRVKNTSATDNLPLRLEIPTGPDKHSSVRLDV